MPLFAKTHHRYGLALVNKTPHGLKETRDDTLAPIEGAYAMIPNVHTSPIRQMRALPDKRNDLEGLVSMGRHHKFFTKAPRRPRPNAVSNSSCNDQSPGSSLDLGEIFSHERSGGKFVQSSSIPIVQSVPDSLLDSREKLTYTING